MKQRQRQWQWLTAWYWPIIFAITSHIALIHILRNSFAYEPTAALKFAVYFGLYLVFAMLIRKLNSSGKSTPEEPHPAWNWPVSGPIRYLGRYAMLFTFYPTVLLSALNPYQLSQQFQQLFGQMKAAKQLKGNEAANAEYQTKVTYRLPFKGEWLVFNGGLSKATSHSWDVLAQRYAYDFAKADEHYRRHSGQGNRLRHYYCYDQPILAAAAGEVVQVVDKIGPAPLVGFGVADFLCRNFAGNHVVIKHAEGEYGFYAHLIKGSIPVAVGDKVAAGEEIGRCGHTGHSSEPHLHFHLQNNASIYTGLGLPIRFQGVGEITRGMKVNGLA